VFELRICDINKVFDSATAITASSADGAFPVANVAHFHCAKVWRSTGNFVIDSSNNSIDFDIGAGELNATITPGTYTAAGLAVEIITQLNAEGAGTYTAAISASTGKWTLTKSAGTFELLWLTGTNLATTIAAALGFSAAADLTGALTYAGALVAIHTEEWVKFDLGAATNIDSFAMLFDKRIGHKFTSPTLKLQANASDSWASPSVDVALSIDEKYDILTYFFSSNQNYRYWRIKIVDPTNTNLYVQLGTVFLSKATQLTQLPEIGLTAEWQDLSTSQLTPYGHRYVDAYPRLRSFHFDFRYLSEADLQTLVDIHDRVGGNTPVLVALDPLATIYDKDRWAIYGYMDGRLGVDNPFYTFFNGSLDIRETQ